jgi:hypothetical protein
MIVCFLNNGTVAEKKIVLYLLFTSTAAFDLLLTKENLFNRGLQILNHAIIFLNNFLCFQPMFSLVVGHGRLGGGIDFVGRTEREKTCFILSF